MQHLDSIKTCCFIIIFLAHNNFESHLFSSESSQIIPTYIFNITCMFYGLVFFIKVHLQHFNFYSLYKKSMRRAIMVQIRLLSIKLSDVVKFIGFSQNIPVFRRVRVLKVGRMLKQKHLTYNIDTNQHG